MAAPKNLTPEERAIVRRFARALRKADKSDPVAAYFSMMEEIGRWERAT